MLIDHPRPELLRAEIAARKAAVGSVSGWRILEAANGPASYDGVWMPDWVDCEFAGQQIETEIFWPEDDPNYRFLTIDDCPGLTPQEVEHINFPHRGAHLCRLAVMTRYDFDYFDAIYDRADRAQRRRPAAAARVAAPEQVFIGSTGGWMPFGASETRSSTAAKVWQRNRVRIARNWGAADQIRSNLKARGIELIDFRNGTEWVHVGIADCAGSGDDRP